MYLTTDQEVGGSNPSGFTFIIKHLRYFLVGAFSFVPNNLPNKARDKVYLCMHNGIEILDPDRPTVGAKLKFQSPQELQDAVDDYFEIEEKITLTGLALHLGLTRQSVQNYKHREEFSEIIIRAVQRIEALYEEKLVYGNKPTGVIFALKCGLGWRESSNEVEPTKNDIKSQFQRDLEEVNRLHYKKKSIDILLFGFF